MHYVIDCFKINLFFPRITPRAYPLQDRIKEKCLTNLQIELAVNKGI